MRASILLSAALLAGGAAIASPAPKPAASGVFEPPLSVERIPLGGDAKGAARKRRLSCFFYRRVRVKELDLGEVGAAELAILPLAPGAAKVRCERRAAPGEIVIPAKEWSGYFKGVKSGYVFFDAEDGNNGGLGFAVFDERTGRKLFEDLAVGELRAAEPGGAALRLRYRRAFAAACSIPQDGKQCWTATSARLPGLETAPPPDCAAGYLKAKSAMAAGRCEAQGRKRPDCLAAEMKRLDEQRWNEAPSVIGYDAEAEVGGGRQSVRALGGALSCWPAD